MQLSCFDLENNLLLSWTLLYRQDHILDFSSKQA